MSLYLLIEIVAIAVPLALSFEKNLQLYKRWIFVFAAIVLSMIPFLIWDIIFAYRGVWGFNTDYHLNVLLLKLPLEEWLFFVIVPYCCIFTYYVFKFHFPKYHLNEKIARQIGYALIFPAIALAVVYFDRSYTAVNLLFFALVSLVSLRWHSELFGRFLLVFPVLCVPFTLMNGILTGTGIEGEIVWYNSQEIIGWRFGTIPFEDFFFAFSLILLNLFLLEKLEKRFKKTTPQ